LGVGPRGVPFFGPCFRGGGGGGVWAPRNVSMCGGGGGGPRPPCKGGGGKKGGGTPVLSSCARPRGGWGPTRAPGFYTKPRPGGKAGLVAAECCFRREGSPVLFLFLKADRGHCVFWGAGAHFGPRDPPPPMWVNFLTARFFGHGGIGVSAGGAPPNPLGPIFGPGPGKNKFFFGPARIFGPGGADLNGGGGAFFRNPLCRFFQVGKNKRGGDSGAGGLIPGPLWGKKPKPCAKSLAPESRKVRGGRLVHTGGRPQPPAGGGGAITG